MRKTAISRFIYLIIFIFIIISCTKYNELEINSIEKLEKLGEIQITKWQILGPFDLDLLKTKNFNSMMEYDFLTNFGYEEAQIEYNEFKKINRKNAENKGIIPSNFINYFEQVEHDHINFYKCFFNVDDLQEEKRQFRCAYAALLDIVWYKSLIASVAFNVILLE